MPKDESGPQVSNWGHAKGASMGGRLRSEKGHLGSLPPSQYWTCFVISWENTIEMFLLYQTMN